MKLLATVLAAALLPAAPAGRAAEPSARERRTELRELQRQIEARKREISEARRQADRLRRDMGRLAGETSESRRKVRGLEARISEAERRKADLKDRLGALQLAENQWQEVVSDEVDGYHRHAAGQSALYGSGDLWEEAFRRAAILEKVRYVSGLHGTKLRTEAAQAEVLRQRAQWRARTNAALAEHRSRELVYRRTQAAYRETRQKVAETEDAVKELQDSAAALAHLIQTLERKSPYRGAPVPLAEPKNSLPWPAEGRVEVPFGRTQVPSLNTWVVHRGIRLATPPAAPVRPVKAGKVIFSGPFRSYGEMLILDHGQGFFTVYGLLGERRKNKGDAVQAPDVLGLAGRPEAARPGIDEGTLYFEIRQSGDALNPLDWLRKR